MNDAANEKFSSVDEQASLWAARLDGGAALSAAERAALEAWLAKDPEHRARLSQYCQFSADLEEQMLELVATGAIDWPEAEEKTEKIPERAPRRTSRRHWLTAVTFATAAAVVFALWVARPAKPSSVQFATAAAQRQAIELEDGTHVLLNAHTSLVVENTSAERHVRLTGGEAFFEVSKDKSRPFIVETPAGAVRVTGTVFDVRNESAVDLAVTVIEGSVQVRAESAGSTAAPVALGPGDRLLGGEKGVTLQKLSAGELDDALAWRSGQIVFDGMPLREALARLARYHGRAITATPEAAELRVSGRYSLDDLDGLFAGLEVALPVRVTRDLSGAVQVSLRPKT